MMCLTKYLNWLPFFLLIVNSQVNAQLLEDGSVPYSIIKEVIPSIGSTAGNKYIDTIFNNTILKATDDKTIKNNLGCTNSYSYVADFNKDSTKMYVVCDFANEPGHKRAVILNFDSKNFTVGNGIQINNSPNCQEYWMIWSHVDPDVMYCNSASALYSYKVSTQTWTLIHNFSAQLLATGNSLNQMSITADDNIFSWHQENTKGITAYKRSTDTVIANFAWPSVDESYVDKSGKYLVSGNTNADNDIWDISSGSRVLVSHMGPLGEGGWYHHDQGVGVVFAGDSNCNLLSIPLATPNSVTNLLKTFPGATCPWNYGTQQDHFSMTGDNNNWALASRYSKTGMDVKKAFDDEMILVAMDGSGKVRRLGHTYINFNGDYYQAEFANMSPDGQFVTWASNWGVSGGRIDVYIRKITAAPGSSAPPPILPLSKPTNLKILL